MAIQMTCNKCRGAGTIIKNPCDTCTGSGVARVKSEEVVTIPQGINSGQNLRMTGKVTQQVSSIPLTYLVPTAKKLPQTIIINSLFNITSGKPE